MRVTVVDATATTELRRSVLRPAWAPGTAMPGDDDASALHVAAFEDGTVVGAAVLFARTCPHHPDVDDAWQLRGMATADGHRGHGIGAAVLAAALDTVRDRDASLLWCKARVTAQDFYAAHGFTTDTAEYVEPETGLAHRDMSRFV